MQPADDPVLDARLTLMEGEETLAECQRLVESADVVAVGSLTAAGVVIAPVVALLAAASTSDFTIPSPWDLGIKIAAVAVFAAAMGSLGFALHVRSDVEDAAKVVRAARERVIREERAAEIEQLDRELAASGATATLWATLRKRFRG